MDLRMWQRISWILAGWTRGPDRDMDNSHRKSITGNWKEGWENGFGVLRFGTGDEHRGDWKTENRMVLAKWCLSMETDVGQWSKGN